MQISPFNFYMKSEVGDDGKPVLDFTNQPVQLWSKVLLWDAVWSDNFFPKGEIILNDVSGLIADYLVSVEGLKFETKFGSSEDGFIECEYVGSDNQITEAILNGHIAGTTAFWLYAYYKWLDYKRSFGWKDTISNVVRDLLKNVYRLEDTKKIFIEDTTSTIDVWYQINETAEATIKRLSNVASSQNNPTSPYLTFFNCDGEFYFMTINKMFEQEVINKDNPYIVELEETMQFNIWNIKDYTTAIPGLSKTKDNYRKNIFKLIYKDSKTVAESETKKIEDFKIKGDGNLLLRKDLLNQFTETSTVNFGIYENTDKDIYNGFVNSQFVNTYLPLRVTGVIAFNPFAVSGKVINCRFGSGIKEKAGYSKEYDGKWLILASRHFIDPDGVPMQRLVLGKNIVQIDPGHPFKKQLV